MKIDGNTRISICYEDDFGKITIENYKLNEIVNYIAAQAYMDIQLGKENYGNKTTKYIIINDKKYNLKTDIHMEFEVSLLNIPLVCTEYFTQKYNIATQLELKDFYKKIVKIVEDYAYELDTDINNIKVETKALQILNVYKKEGE